MDAFQSFKVSAVYNVGLKFSFRLLTFVLNAVLFRYLTKEVLGVANVRLMLLYTTLSFLTREPFRRACLHSDEEEEEEGEGEENDEVDKSDQAERDKRRKSAEFFQLVNVLWLCPLICIPIGVLLCGIWIWILTSPDPDQVQYYPQSVVAYALAVFIESLAEPLWILGQKFFLVRSKAVIESVQAFLQHFIVGVLYIKFPHWNLMAFSIAMVLSSTLYTVFYYCYFWRVAKRPSSPVKTMRSLFPRLNAGFDKNILGLVSSFRWHSVVKQLLTEGERYVMTFFNVLNFGDQGVYDVIHNLGSLVARFVFAPLEESAYVFFSLTLIRDRPATEQNKEKFPVATRVLCALLKLTALTGCIICVFGRSYSYLALDMYGGKLLSSGPGPTLLRWYCVYVLLLAMNGITECFVVAAMRRDQIDRHQLILAIFCVFFLSAAVFLSREFGSLGFIWANCFNMALRIAYSMHFIFNFYRSVPSIQPLKQMLPSWNVFYAFLISTAFTFLSEILFCCDGLFNSAAHVAVGAMCFFATVMTVYRSETELIEFIGLYVLRNKAKTV